MLFIHKSERILILCGHTLFSFVFLYDSTSWGVVLSQIFRAATNLLIDMSILSVHVMEKVVICCKKNNYLIIVENDWAWQAPCSLSSYNFRRLRTQHRTRDACYTITCKCRWAGSSNYRRRSRRSSQWRLAVSKEVTSTSVTPLSTR